MAKIDYEQFYAGEAARYESTRYGSSYGRLFRVLQRNATSRALNLAMPGGYRLDVATGTGQMLPALADSGAFVVASDLTRAMLGQARRECAGVGEVFFSLGDASSLPYPDNRFDVVASSRFLHLFEAEKQEMLIREMTRVLRPGGILIVDFYSTHGRRWVKLPMAVYRLMRRKRPENDHRVTIRQAQDMVANSGLQFVGVEGIGNLVLALMPWLPLSWRVRIGEWLGHHCIYMSEQFLVAARKP